MIEFRTPQLEDKVWVSKALRDADEMACEYCFGNLYMWSGVYHNTIAEFDGMLLAKDMDAENRPSYLYPCGNGDKKAAILELQKLAEAEGVPLTLYCLTEQRVQELESLFPGAFRIEPCREYFDYIYDTEVLANLAGRKYHGKRNHVSFFKKTYNWQYEAITPENLEECYRMTVEWKKRNAEKNPEELEGEFQAIERGMTHFFDLGFIGGLLRVDGEVVAYTFGEALNEKLFVTHVEKAFADYRGAYPMMNQEFTKNALMGFEKVNREEDTGSEGLRRAKESYYPSILLPKYTATYKG